MAPTMGSIMLPPVMDNIYKRARHRKSSLGGPSYVVEERKKSNSMSDLLTGVDENSYAKQIKLKSNSVMHLGKRTRDDLAFHKQHQRYSEADYNRKKKKKGMLKTDLFDYDRILQDERKEFEFRLKDIPKASGQLSDFLVIKKLAAGQFGRVYLAEDATFKKKCAIKTISKDLILRANLVAEVKAERDYLYAANSPFIVSLIQHFEDDTRVYFVEEYVSGGDLYEHLNFIGPFSDELTKFYVAQVVLALEYLHNVNLIYRDLKPENVMIDSTGYIKLVDFGFVKRVEMKTSTMVGTPAYIAPEMILHKPYDKTVDWWSLGILIYEMLAGCQITPFADSNRMAMYEKITSKEVTFPASRKFPHTPVRLLIKSLLKVNPSLRLGNGPNGSRDVKNHPWFASVNWIEMYRRRVTPPSTRSNNLAMKTNHSANIIPAPAQPTKPLKVTALKQSLLGARGGVAANKAPQADTIQNRLRLEKLMKIR